MSQVKKLKKLHRREMREQRASKKHGQLVDRGKHCLGGSTNSPVNMGKQAAPQIDN